MQSYKNIDGYLDLFPEDVRAVLQRIRSTIKKAAPDAVEAISYGIPTFKLNGKNLVHFAAFKKHYSFFPTSSGVEAFKDELKDYEVSKGTIQFPSEKPMPFELIETITKFRVEQIENVSKNK